MPTAWLDSVDKIWSAFIDVTDTVDSEDESQHRGHDNDRPVTDQLGGQASQLRW